MNIYPAARRLFQLGSSAASLITGRKTRVQLTKDMSIDSNGVAAAAILGTAALAVKAVMPRSRAWLLPAAALLPVAAFFRDPEREIPTDLDAVLAASDGRVLSIEQVTDPRAGGEEHLRIAVFLSVLDVHVNRAPVAGKVLAITQTIGGYAAAQTEPAEHNVAQYTTIESPHGNVVVAQRTGLIARRIVNRSRVGKRLEAGQRYGLIRFGSRTDVYLPVGKATPAVGVGDKVRGGETVIARWN
ncbi:MAG TPA: phosphatidylserine decarboxylase [Mycobacteriales bacterium]|jgi:phosphatidylserine decarboxylase|nr:phosphatidylserine decarboxylase [Mycobacteriales bacterium]